MYKSIKDPLVDLKTDIQLNLTENMYMRCIILDVQNALEKLILDILAGKIINMNIPSVRYTKYCKNVQR